MTSDPFSDARILDVWKQNAALWTDAVRERHIASRRLITDRAILAAVLDQSPRTALDLGCGEGWLSRAMAAYGIRVTGIDAVPELIERARASGGGEFQVQRYEDIAAGGLALRVDAVVCNFALLGDASVEGAFAAVPKLLKPGGRFIVQTLHPVLACGEQPYRDGWREGSRAGAGADFGDPAPWYFRTLEGWFALFRKYGLLVQELREPLHPETGQAASVIFIATPE
jgi:2-polyprenyl-3-methyl-5-hydroxy-6-metoxy-1,4-benzoquinol methylase